MTHSDTNTAAVHGYSPESDRERLAEATPRNWSFTGRIGFRFLFVYLLTYTFPGAIDSIPYSDFLDRPFPALWRAVVPWVGAHVLRLSHPVSLAESGSSDKVFDWVRVFSILMVAAIGAVVWSLIDRAPRSHRKLLAVLRVYVRFHLAATLFSYGFDKIFPNQFEHVNPIRLTEYVGEASPGGFAWSFLGFSIPYEIFAGSMETLAACLLLLRRTSTLGAIVGAAALTNVFALNMAFDIPVKQFSAHLLLMCILLVALDAGRLLSVFVRQRPSAAPAYVELFGTRRSLLAWQTFGVFLAASMIWQTGHDEYKNMYEFGRLAPRPPLYGIYEVNSVVKNGVIQPALLTDATRWRRLSVAGRGGAVRLATDSLAFYRVDTDSSTHVASFTPFPDTVNKLVGKYAFPDSMHLVFRGRVREDSIEIAFTRRPEKSYLLVSRGFHWVNEVPYFR